MMVAAENASGRERKLQTLLTAYIVTGLFFLLLYRPEASTLTSRLPSLLTMA